MLRNIRGPLLCFGRGQEQGSARCVRHLLQNHVTPRGEAPEASPSGLEQSLLFLGAVPCSKLATFRCFMGYSSILAGLFQLVAGTGTSVPALGLHLSDLFLPTVGHFPCVAVLFDKAGLFKSLLSATHPHMVRVAGLHEPTQLPGAVAGWQSGVIID